MQILETNADLIILTSVEKTKCDSIKIHHYRPILYMYYFNRNCSSHNMLWTGRRDNDFTYHIRN